MLSRAPKLTASPLPNPSHRSVRLPHKFHWRSLAPLGYLIRPLLSSKRSAYPPFGFQWIPHLPSLSEKNRDREREREEERVAMASATARATFSFHHHRHTLHPTKPSKSHLPLPFLTSKTPIFSSPHKLPIPHHLAISSVDVSQEDKPLSRPEDDPSPEQPPAPEKQEPKLDPRRFEERFALLNTGIYECRSCGYRYDEKVGDPSYPIPPGFQFAKLPDDWRCPTCGAAKSFFESKSVEVAGFAQNQQFGLGGNTLTAGQKAVLIYGGLLLGFVLFLSGYFLQ